MSKHTAGPWIAPAGQTNLVCTERDWNSQQIGALKMGFQAIVSLQQGEKQAEANARLIAAAPSMVSVLESVKKFLADPPHDPNGNHKSGLLILVADTIAKATGEG